MTEEEQLKSLAEKHRVTKRDLSKLFYLYTWGISLDNEGKPRGMGGFSASDELGPVVRKSATTQLRAEISLERLTLLKKKARPDSDGLFVVDQRDVQDLVFTIISGDIQFG